MAGRTLGVADAEPVLDALTVTGTTAFTGAVTAAGALTVSGAATLNGNTIIGNAVTDTIAFYGVAGTAQLAAAAQATTAASWVTICGAKAAFGTSDDAVTLLNTIKNIQHVLKTTGLWKGSS